VPHAAVPLLCASRMHPEEQVSSFNADPDLSATMGLNWKSVTAAHVTQACEALLKSAGPRAKPRGLIVTYKGQTASCEGCPPDGLSSRPTTCLLKQSSSFRAAKLVFNVCGRLDFKLNDCKMQIVKRPLLAPCWL
jgi:hypothetical protein